MAQTEKTQKLNRFRQKFKEAYSTRQSKNPAFSMRAFAKFLELPVSTTKYLLDGTRLPSASTIDGIAEKLKWTEREVSQAKSDVARIQAERNQVSKTRWVQFEANQELLGDTAVLALRCLSMIPQKSASVGEIARELGITEARAEVALRTLVNRKLVIIDENQLRKSETGPYFALDPRDPLMSAYRRDLLKKALRQSEKGTPDRGRTLMFNIPLAKKDLDKVTEKINRLRRELMAEFPPQGDEEVYSALITVFPYRFETDS